VALQHQSAADPRLMVGLDTNVLIRFLIRDDEAQFERACNLIRSEARREEFVCISLLVLLETEWVLRSRYKLAKEAILETFSELLDAGDIRFEDEPAIARAVLHSPPQSLYLIAIATAIDLIAIASPGAEGPSHGL
jgi:predicted nucleic-acid-binding protein